jgi:hypothetical protein
MSWRYRLPIIQAFLVVLLFSLAIQEQNRYDEWFFRTHPRAFEIDNAYNPPARLVALLICGPGLLIPFGTRRVEVESFLALLITFVCVVGFWFWVGLLVERNFSGRRPRLWSSLWRCSFYAEVLYVLSFVLRERTILLTLHLDANIRQYLAVYGLRAQFLLDLAALGWLLGLFACAHCNS